jgi:hypothetical protein
MWSGQPNLWSNTPKVCLVPIGADDRIFRPQPDTGQKDDLISVLYYGTYIPTMG